MADDDPWLLKEDGYLKVDVECKNIIYHPNLNVLLITTGTNRVFVFDVNLGIVLHRSRLSGKSDGKLQGVYLAEGVDKILYTDGRGIGVRSDYNGVLLLDTMLQIPVSKNEDSVKIELLLSEAFILHQCLRCIELPGVEHVQEVLQELWNKIISAQSSKRYGIKAQKWNTVCLDLPHVALKQVCSSLVMELKKQNKHIPALPIASAISERLNTLLPSIILDGGPADKALMFSEAARRETFSKWPHMNYNESKSRNNVLRWALPGQMAQAGFYHEPNNTAEDRAMCFTCNVCLVCWEPTDEPWSEHERHSPACPFVKGEYTQNVPMSVTLATAPAREASDTVEVIGTTNVAGLAATASYNGLVNVWNISGQLKGEMTFYVSVTDQESNNKESHKFYGVRNLSSQYLSALTTESDSSDYKSSPSTIHKLHLTSMSLLGSPKLTSNEFNQGLTTSKGLESEQRDPTIRPCLACGITVYSTAGQRTLDNVWSSTDLAPSASLVRAMNNVNSATSDSLDIMKVAGEKNNSLQCHYIVLYDFHHKSTVPMQSAKDEPSKGTKTKKAPSGTGTSASSTGGRQESIYSEFYMSKLLYDAPVIEDVDSEMVVGAHFDGLFTTTCLTASSSNALYAPPFSYSVAPSTTTPYDTNFNPMNGSDQFASTSELGKKSIEMTNKSIKADPIVLQTIPIEAHPSLRITYTGPTKDGKYLFVAITPVQQLPIMSSNASGNANKMDIDDESELFSQKSCMYWDQNYGGNKLINGDTQYTQPDSSLLLVYTLDFTDKVPKLVSEPLLKRELTLDQTPIEIVFLPLQDKHKSLSPNKPHGQVALVCRDGIVRVIDLSTLKIINEARSENEKFISVAYCNRLERLCACTSTGSLRFFAMTDEDESTDEKDDLEDISMMTESTSADNVTPSTSTSTQPEPMIAQRSNLSYNDLKTLYDLTKLDKHSPAYSATVPACWSEMMQAQRQRRYPQHLHQSEDQHHTRTWRLQNDATTWDEHIFELTLPRNVAGIVGQVDVRFTLHTPCLDPPNVQVTLLKQNLVGMCHRRTPRTSVDERINFNISGEQKGENPITSEEYQRQHNTQILCGPINLKRCLDLSDHSGCITLTSPKLFRTKARTLLVHLKALKDPAKEGECSKVRGNVETKPHTSKKLRIDEAGPFLPGATVERIAAASANKKLEYYIGCDWIHEISITVRCVQNTELTNQRLQRLMMLESIPFTRNLLNIACLEGLEKTLACQSLALDILVWMTSIRLARLRLSHNVMDSRALQLDTIRCIQEKLHTLLKTCILDAGRSIAHKCVKLIIICSEGLRNSEDGAVAHSFDDAVLSVIVSLMPSVIGIQWAGSLRWLAVLITRLMPLDKTHSMTQQCINILQLISKEMTNRVNPYHLLLATRFGLYNNPFETELFDMEPPVPPKFNSLPVTYASIVTGSEQTTSTNSMNPQYSQDHIDLRDLLTLPTNPGSELVVPSKLKALCTNHNMKGLLEVEPLHYICHAASDGTKMEKIDAQVNSTGGLFDGSGASDLKIPQSADDMNFPWSRLLSWPLQQALVVERMHSGARRFVVLDFGSPILLTDLIIPSCSDLVSLSIDIWTKSEEIDGTRLVVAGDIGTKPLVVNDLQPPPVCRFFKITTIGRYGMTTTRCKIPIGTFYGHMFVLPGEDYSEISQGDTNFVTTIESQCSILSALVEDVQCRFSLATEKLKGLLEPLLCSETPNVVHMQHYLCKGRAESRGQPSNKILTTYHECIMFQHQLNVVRGVWRRLETWKDPTAVHSVDISNVPSDKLRILGEMLHDVLLYTMYEIGPVPPVPNSLCDIFTPEICEKFFHSVCVVTPAPRLQLHAAALLARMAGHQSWWGDFLANTLVNLYSTSTTHIFPQDRVFILLTFLGRKSLIAGANKSTVVEAMVKTLGKLLSPLSNDQGSVTTRLDTTLISWVLLFLSVCLDTTANHSTSTDEQSDKSKEQAIPSRWEFLQGESAMQRKYVSASRSSASRNYRKKIQKRLMHHKQQLQDIEQAKKGAQSPSAQSHAWSSMTQLPAVLTTKLEVLKSHERHLKKTLKQHSAFKHFKDMLRRNDQPHSSRRYHASPGARTDAQDIDLDTMANLSHQHVLPVARGLIELILNHSANVDMFLLACKVVARLVVSTRPFINLGDLMTEEQLLKLMKLATSNSDTAWSSHAISCLLQDLLEGGRLFPKSSPVQESQSDEQFETNDDSQTGDDDLSGVAGNSGSSTTLGNDEGFADGDGEDTQDSIAAAAPVTPSTSKLNGFELSSFLESDDSELEEFLDDILERGRNMLKKGSAITKLPPSASSGISLALDARLEYGVEMGVEIALRRYSTLGAYNLPLAINATIQPPQVDPKASTSRGTSSSASWSPPEPSATSLSMLTRCFDRIFMDLALQASNTSLEQVLQFWLTLNLDASGESSSSPNFDTSLTPVIPLRPAAISSLISAFVWSSGVTLKAWCLLLQTLTLCSNEIMSTNPDDLPIEGLLGGMASIIVKDRNMGPMLLKLLSGNGLNVDTKDKQFIMAGPRVGFALQDFLVRLEMRCDVITPASSLGNSMKELLLQVLYQLVQPGGALEARRGPLDAQCILITSLNNLNFINTDLGTAMSITECVGVIISSYVKEARVGVQCSGAVDTSGQTIGFGGLFSSVLGSGGNRQGKPTNWDSLVIALIKLVSKLVQTPLPSRRTSTIDMEIGYSAQRQSELDNQKLGSQTDESKAAEQTTMRNSQGAIPKPKYPCVADTVLQHEPTMMRLLGALGMSTSSSLGMLIGEDSVSTPVPEIGDALSVADVTFQLLVTLMKKATTPNLVLNPLYRYLSSTHDQLGGERKIMQLSEPLLWYILKVLDNETALSVFTSMGGIRVLCENMVKCSTAGQTNTGLSTPGVISLVMQHLSNTPNLPTMSSSSSSAVPATSTTTTTNTTSSSNKKSSGSLESHDDGLLNFAPLGTISWMKPMVEPADVLIQSATPHRRARTAAWSYHFFPGEAWIDLTISLPCAILLREVELQPHLTSLATCPSAVSLEISRDGSSDLMPVCPPMLTAGLTFIKLTLTQPEVMTSILIRLYKPRDSPNISLSQIRLLGTTAFGEVKSKIETVDEEQLTKSSLGWLRLLHQCLSVSSLSSNLSREVLNSAASVDGLVEACCSLLLHPAPSLFTPNLEKVLLQLGLHSNQLGLRLINLLLNNRCTPLIQNTSTNKKSSTIVLIVELLQQLCASQDAGTEARVSAVLNWLYTSAMAPRNHQNNPNFISPPAIYIHCISTIIWKSHELPDRSYNLDQLLTNDLFNSLYQWTLGLERYSALKQAIDGCLCAFCYVKPSLFPLLLQHVKILIPNLATDHSASISDDRKENECQTDDRKSETNEEWYGRLQLPNYKCLQLTDGQLLTVAAAARSNPGIIQLIDSGLPGLLVNMINEFCLLQNVDNVNKNESGKTDSDKADEVLRKNNTGLNMTDPDGIATVLEFLTLVCTEGKMRDWLGSEGGGFWLVLAELLGNRPVENPRNCFARMNVSYTRLESSMIKFLSRCCWCHPNNQKLLAELLTNVILKQRTSSNVRYLHGISGFTRRLILQLLLESEKILVSIGSDNPMNGDGGSNALPSMPPHPAHPHGHYHQLLYISTQSTVGDILQQISDGPSTSKGSSSSSQGVTVSSLRQEYLIHPSRPNTPLPSQLTIGQLLALIDDSGVSLSEPCIHLILRQKTKDTKDDVIKFDDNNLIGYKSIESALGVFSAGGGLAVLAKHLPLVYPDTGRTQVFPDKTISPEQNEAEWVKVEASEDIYEEVEEAGATASPRATPPTPHVPFHSLAAFGIFLRLPGYAEVLLRDRKQAQCLLRLALGVTDDGEGGDILSSPLASALPTLPFQVLKQLLEATPPTTDDGQLLRRTMVDIGAVLLLLNCLAIFTHQTGYSDSGDPRPAGSGRSDDKSHLYWAKGTGFGTGSTQQSWNVEQALLRQRSEEEHVTVLLTVLASYIGQQGTQPERELPSTFGESLLRSCLLPALSSYLRNDSVLDMARHIPLYRAVLQLLRSIALSPQLVPLLLPRPATTSNEPSIVSLLSSMKTCVDNYVHKINRTKGNKSKSTTTKYQDDIEQDEGLATLIPDIQESAGIVKNATTRIGTINEDTAGPCPSSIERPLKSTEERYLEVMRNLQFDTFEMICENSDGNGYKFVVSYHFESNMRAAGERCHPVRVKRLAQEAVTLSSALPLSYSSSVFVRCDADRLDIMKVLITGPAETPYANGCFEFDVYFPPDYPRSPMMINLETTGRHTVRFNPNLYNDGKVCLSILNTWHGRPEEKWNSHTSSFLQVLVSIQSLILVPEPYFNEPGYERSRGTSSGAQSSQEYNANVCLATVKWAMLDQIVNPCPCFKEVIHKHFWIKRHEIVAQLESWIMDMEMYASDRRLARTISLNALALRRHYRLLRDALNKIPTPEGLEDLAGPLPPLNSNLEVSSSGTPVATTPTPTTPTTSSTNMTPISIPLTNSGLMPINNPTQSTTNNHVHHDIDTDVEMEKMVSKVCE